jgi:hypothetical protein
MIEDEGVGSSRKMSSPSSLKAKGKQKGSDVEAITSDPEDASDSGSPSGSSDSGSDGDSDSDSNSVSDSDPSEGSRSGSGAGPEPSTDDPLSRDDLLAYLENMRQRFSTKQTSDSFTNQEEEILIVTSKKKSHLAQPLNAP